MSSFEISRRQLVGGAIASSALAVGPAFAASSKIGRVMVQGRPQDTGSPYKFAAIMPALDKLGGVRKMRCRDPYSGTVGWKTYVRLATEGHVRFCFTLSVRDISRTVSDLSAFLKAAPNSILAIEFPNEPDLNPVSYKGVKDPRLGFRTGTAPAFMAYIRDVRAALSSQPELRSIPLIASNDYMQKQQAPYTAYGNSHIYPKPTSDISRTLADFAKKLADGNHRYGFITEWGRTTGGSASNVTSPPVSLAKQAELLSSDVSKVLAMPAVQVLNIYELFAWGGTSEMNNFGLFEANGSPRPAAAAIRSVIG